MSEHANWRSTLTAARATWQSLVLLVPTEEDAHDPSEIRVGSFHAPSAHASADPAMNPQIGKGP